MIKDCANRVFRDSHPDDAEALAFLEECAFRYSKKHKLGLRTFGHRKRCGKFGWTGVCYSLEKAIGTVIRYRVDGEWENRLEPHYIMKVLAHELAHLIDKGHNKRHSRLTAFYYKQMIDSGEVRRFVKLMGHNFDADRAKTLHDVARHRNYWSGCSK